MIKHKFLVSTADMALMLSLHEDARYANMIAQREALVSMGADLMPFPNQVNVQPAPAVAGDFASTNPRSAYPAGPGGPVAGAAGARPSPSSSAAWDPTGR